MSIYIKNSLTRKKEEFLPLQSPHVNIYTCGVTVYDDCHIGHARSLYIFNVIKNYLKYRGFDVRFVRNITDIDDKIINRANELKTDWRQLVSKYIERYYEDLNALGIEKADFEPRATENIPEMIRYIKLLIDKDNAYVTATGVYFRVRKFSEYGKLSGQSIDQMESGVRKEQDETKDDPLDFALWKMSKPGEPFWPSPWGNGRPGWHIECSVMSQKFLATDTLDIHAGGMDLIFPHHENETAQAEALTGKPFAKYWIHHGLLTINGQKMSKSLGNFVTIKDFLAKYKDADLLKLFFLSAHYSHPIDYTEEKINETNSALQKLNGFFSESFLFWLYDMAKEAKERFPDFGSLVPKQDSGKFRNTVDSFKAEFERVMDNDFNTPEMLAVVFKMWTFIWNFRQPLKVSIEDLKYTKDAICELKDIVKSVFSLSLSRKLTPEINEIKIERERARKSGDFQKADKIRAELEQKGYMVADNKDGSFGLF